MKKIKKIGKRILCGVIAIVSMLSITLPVYAADNTDISTRTYFSGTDYQGNRVQISADARFLSVRSMHVSTDGSEDTTWTKRSVFLITNNPDVTYIRSIGDVTVNINTAIGSQLNLLSCLLNNLGADTVNSVLSDEEKQSLSDYSVICLFNDSSIANYYGTDCYDYELTHKETPWQSCPIGGSLKDLLVNFIKPNISNFKLGAYWDDDGNLKEPSELPDDTDVDSDYLPMLTYSLKRTTVLGFPSITQIKENLTWDYTEKEIYKDNPTKYNVEVWVSANWKAAPTGIGNIRDVSNMQFNDKAKLAIDSAIPIVKNSYGWLYSDKGKKLYKEAGENWGDESGYNLFIRTYEVGGSKVSYWKVYNLALGGYVQQEDTLIDENGNKVPISDDDYDIGNTEHDGKNKDDQSSDAPFSTDNKDDADESPTSDFNKSNGNYSIDSFLGSIKNVINTISEIPSLLSSLASWLDPRLIVLITASIALVISIGVVKMIL